MKILIRDIEYDTHVDDISEMSAQQIARLKRSIKRLPAEMIIELDDSCASDEFEDIAMFAIDKVSDRTGWLVQQSSLEMLSENVPPGFDVDAFNKFCRK